tara:strand:+ start:3321 stop:3965 length:645 start_codon:yes stop_codon:yes gene_type:complete
MTSTLGYSIIDESNNEEENKKEKTKEAFTTSKTRKNKTVKMREGFKKNNKKAESFLNSLKPSVVDANSDDEDDGLSNYEPTDNVGSNLDNSNEKSEEKEMLNQGLNQQNEFILRQENFQKMHQERKDNLAPYLSELTNYTDYQNPNNNYTNENRNVMQTENDLMKKLNYVVHMLEEQQDEKTQSITEELILYTFLGIFVIFVVDSFSKVTKYKR